MKGDVEGEAEKENQEREEDIDLISHKHDRALKGAYRSFVIPDAPKTDMIAPLIKPSNTSRR